MGGRGGKLFKPTWKYLKYNNNNNINTAQFLCSLTPWVSSSRHQGPTHLMQKVQLPPQLSKVL